jgi:DNA topoisomerase-1
LKPEQDPFSITLEEAVELILEKREQDKNKYIAEFGDIQVLNGRYGPYIKQGRKNYKIPKDVEPKELTEEDCKKIIAETPQKKSRARKKK